MAKVRNDCFVCNDEFFISSTEVEIHFGEDGFHPAFVCTCPTCGTRKEGALTFEMWDKLVMAGARQVSRGSV